MLRLIKFRVFLRVDGDEQAYLFWDWVMGVGLLLIMERYKEEIERLKQKALLGSVEDSEDCWNRFPGKKKSRYSECSKGATIPFHVFCEGKRLLKTLKNETFEKCKKIVEPKGIQGCRSKGYEELLIHVASLEQWIDRERSRFDLNKYG